MLSFQTPRPRSTPLDRPSDARIALAPPPSDTVHEAVLSAGTAKRVAIPSGAGIVLFSATGDFRAKFGTSTVAAAIANADVTNGSASELNPAARSIPSDATHVSLIAAAAINVTLSFYGA